MSFLDHIKRCNNADLSQFEPWFVGKTRAGFIHRDFAPVLAAPLFARRDGAWHLDPSLDTAARRTAAMHAFLLELRAAGRFGRLWREEPYPVTWEFTDPPLMAMERAAVPWFGVRAFGPHMTGYVRKADGLHLWVPRRSHDKPTFPGELDNTVAVGVVSYWNQSGPQLKPDVMTCFDLELPADFTPQANDGEVAAFELWPVRRVFETVRDTTQFKYNCNLVLIDFFVRHGLLRADAPDFFRVVEGLRRPQPGVR